MLDGINLERDLAQIDVTRSNTMIEAFSHSLKHSRFGLRGLEMEAEVQRLIAFDVGTHIGRKRRIRLMPHSAHDGQTLNEVFIGTRDAVISMLAAKRVQVETERIARNRSVGCMVYIGRAG